MVGAGGRRGGPGARGRVYHQRSRSPFDSCDVPSLDSSTEAQPRVMGTFPDRGITSKLFTIPEGTHVQLVSGSERRLPLSGDGAEWVQVKAEIYVPSDCITVYMWHVRRDEPRNLSALRDSPCDSAPISQHARLTPNERVIVLKIQGDWALVQFSKLSPSDGPEKGKGVGAFRALAEFPAGSRATVRGPLVKHSTDDALRRYTNNSSRGRPGGRPKTRGRPER